MKKLLPSGLLAIFLFATVGLSAQSQTGDVLKKIYTEATVEDDRLSVLKKLLASKATDLDGFCLQALQDLEARQIEVGPTNEVTTKKALALLLLQNLGHPTDPKAAVVLKAVYKASQDAQLRGTAALTLAKLGNTDLTAAWIDHLTQLNLSQSQSRDDETLANFLVSSLGTVKAATAFEAVFMASNAWYSPHSQVRANALKVLGQLSPDLGEAYVNLMTTSADLTLKLQALTVLDGGNFTADIKLRGALAVLQSCLTAAPPDQTQKRFVGNLRKRTLTVLSNLKARDPATPGVIAATLAQAPDPEEQRLCVRILGNDASDPAVTNLAGQLRGLNSHQKVGGNTQDDLALAREIIAALGRAKNPLGHQALAEVEFSNYTPAIMREAALAQAAVPAASPTK